MCENGIFKNSEKSCVEAIFVLLFSKGNHTHFEKSVYVKIYVFGLKLGLRLGFEIIEVGGMRKALGMYIQRYNFVKSIIFERLCINFATLFSKTFFWYLIVEKPRQERLFDKGLVFYGYNTSRIQKLLKSIGLYREL